MEHIENKSVGEIVAQDYRAAAVFENHKIDFCCNGGRSLADVAAEKGLALESLVEEVKKARAQGNGGATDYESWPLDLLADYIVKTHHRYSDQQITKIKPYLDKIAQVHGDHHPELFKIKEIFNQIAGEISAHTKKEEIIVFPFIKKLINAKEKNLPYENPQARTVEDPVNMLRHEHDNQGDAFKQMAALSNDFTTPEDGCNTYRVTFGLLKEFEQDLHKHIHLENNILFPRAIALEKELTTQH